MNKQVEFDKFYQENFDKIYRFVFFKVGRAEEAKGWHDKDHHGREETARVEPPDSG